MRQREMGRVGTRGWDAECDLAERLEGLGAADAGHQDAVVAESFWCTELEGEGTVRVTESCPKVVEAELPELIFTAKGHVRWDEALLHRVHDRPDRFDVGTEVWWNEEAELDPGWHGQRRRVGDASAGSPPSRVSLGESVKRTGAVSAVGSKRR